MEAFINNAYDKNINIPNENDNKYSVGIYCRLSSEDRDSNISQSIVNQEESLKEYVNRQGWNIYNVYSDDGFTGTSFDRPAFNRMIEDIKLHRINLVITKDLSRLGRNYIQSGYYLEQFFPEHNIRYIALNDNYDSLNSSDEFMPFKNIMNEFYAKDISKKIRFAYNTKVQNGTVIPTCVPYGYIKENKKIRVDENVKEIIQRIFKEYVNTGSPKAIAENLNKDGYPCPSEYNARAGIKKNTYSSESGKWNCFSIQSILKNEAYKGIFVANKTYSISFKDKKRRKSPKSNYVRVKGIYEPIVSDELWNQAAAILKAQYHNPYSTIDNKYSGIAYCGHCGAKMRMYNRRFKDGHIELEYTCLNFANNDSGHTVKMRELDDALRVSLLNLKKSILGNKDLFLNKVANYLNQINYLNQKKENIEERKASYNLKLKQLDNLIQNVFEKSINGFLDEKIANTLLLKYKDEKKDISSKIKELDNNNEECTKLNLMESAISLVSALEEINEDTIIDRDLIVSVVSKIIIKTKPICKNRNKKFITIEFLGLPNEIMEEFLNGAS